MIFYLRGKKSYDEGGNDNSQIGYTVRDTLKTKRIFPKYAEWKNTLKKLYDSYIKSINFLHSTKRNKDMSNLQYKMKDECQHMRSNFLKCKLDEIISILSYVFDTKVDSVNVKNLYESALFKENFDVRKGLIKLYKIDTENLSKEQKGKLIESESILQEFEKIRKLFTINSQINYENMIVNTFEIEKILNNPEVEIKTGYFWEVYLSKDSNFVVKRLKRNSQSKMEYALKTLKDYSMVKQYLPDHMLEQEIMYDNQNKPILLQRKMDTEHMIPLNKGWNIHKMPKIFHNEGNLLKVKEFITATEKLYYEQGLMLDFIGDNIFFSLTNGMFEILILDYGCFHTEDQVPNNEENIRASMDVLLGIKKYLN